MVEKKRRRRKRRKRLLLLLVLLLLLILDPQLQKKKKWHKNRLNLEFKSAAGDPESRKSWLDVGSVIIIFFFLQLFIWPPLFSIQGGEAGLKKKTTKQNKKRQDSCPLQSRLKTSSLFLSFAHRPAANFINVSSEVKQKATRKSHTHTMNGEF